MIFLFYFLFICCIRYDKLLIVISNCEYFYFFSFYYIDIIDVCVYDKKIDIFEGIIFIYLCY